MKKNIWILNHYATNMFKNQGGRHYWFAENLIKKGYKVTIFCASTFHNSSDIIDTGNNKYIRDSVNGIPFVFVKTPCYIGNGFQRIKNMLFFYHNLFPVANDYAKIDGKPDVIIASRYRKGSQVQGVSRLRLLTSEGARYVFSAIIPVENVRDYTCGYRLYSVEILRRGYGKFGDDLIEESGFTCMAELLYKLYIVGARFAEIPFVLRYDFKKGSSKMKVVKTAKNSIKLAFRLRKTRKRILVCGR